MVNSIRVVLLRKGSVVRCLASANVSISVKCMMPSISHLDLAPWLKNLAKSSWQAQALELDDSLVSCRKCFQAIF